MFLNKIIKVFGVAIPTIIVFFLFYALASRLELVDLKNLENNNTIALIGVLIALITYIHKSRNDEINRKIMRQPVLEIWPYDGEKRAPVNQTETRSNHCYIKYCGNEDCKDIHLFNIRLVEGTNIEINKIQYSLGSQDIKK